jgi:hypothetical protein
MGVSYGTGKFFKKEDPVVVAEMELPSVVLNEAHVIELPIDQIHGVFVGDPPSDTLIKSVGLKGAGSKRPGIRSGRGQQQRGGFR